MRVHKSRYKGMTLKTLSIALHVICMQCFMPKCEQTSHIISVVPISYLWNRGLSC